MPAKKIPVPHTVSDDIHEFEEEEREYMDSMTYDSSNTSESEEEDPRKKQAECIRNVANFSTVKSFHLMEKKDFHKEMLLVYLEQAAPKLHALFEKIEKLDEKDMKIHGKHFKHMIFTDVKSSSYGAKLLASAFVAKGFHPALHVQGPGFALHKDEVLLQNPYHNFGVLMSKTFFDRPMNIKFRKNLLELYNRRPENVQGELMRFIILDQGFKEGIDLFDVKYVHLFEPLVVKADEKQAIGRGTRFCGQRGLEFHPRFGWPLYVFRYEVGIPKDLSPRFYNSRQMFDLYLKFSEIDLRKVVFASELEQASIEAAVDRELTRPIHQFRIELPPPILSGGAQLRSQTPNPPPRKMTQDAMQRYISKGFEKFTYPEAKLENKCMEGGASATGNIVQFTPTQDFVRHYFQSSSAYKGMLLFHSVGTGKTCSAIATATTSFEKEGYTILWVTRHTLKSDIWKNMYGQVCSLTIQEQLKNKTLRLPQKISGPMKYVSKQWMEPISYKQFSNMLLQKNKIYDMIVARNGKKDPLRKTLLIIDEAHKLYSPTVAASEKPNTDILEKMIQNSYKTSGEDSVRVLLMTATPYTEDGMEMIQLLNLLREENEQLPETFEEFSKKYLDEHGYFRPTGKKRFQDEMSGYISYLNRSQDARNFAHPVLEDVVVSITSKPEEPEVKEKKPNKYMAMMKELREKIREEKAKMRDLKSTKKAYAQEEKQKNKEQKQAQKDCVKRVNAEAKDDLAALGVDKKERTKKCMEVPTKDRKECKDQVQQTYEKKVEQRKKHTEEELQECASRIDDTDMMRSISAKEKQLDMEDILQNHQDILVGYQEELQDIKAVVGEKKAAKREMAQEIKKLRENIQEEKEPLKKLQKEVEQEKKKIRKIKDKKQRMKEQKILRESKGTELNELKKDVKEMRAKATHLRLSKKLMMIQDGMSKLGDVSQATALEKKCGI